MSDVQRRDGTTAELRSRWLVADLESGEQIIVKAIGPRDTFDDTPLDAILSVCRDHVVSDLGTLLRRVARASGFVALFGVVLFATVGLILLRNCERSPGPQA